MIIHFIQYDILFQRNATKQEPTVVQITVGGDVSKHFTGPPSVF